MLENHANLEVSARWRDDGYTEPFYELIGQVDKLDRAFSFKLSKELEKIGFTQTSAKCDLFLSKTMLFVSRKLRDVNKTGYLYNKKNDIVRCLDINVVEFAKFCGENLDTRLLPSDQKYDDKVLNSLYDKKYEYRSKLDKCLTILLNTSIQIENSYTTKGRKKYIEERKAWVLSEKSPNEFGFSIDMPESVAKFILNNPGLCVPKCLMSLDGHASNAYYLGLNIWKYYTMDANVDKKTHNCLKIKTLLQYVGINTNDKNIKKWSSHIRKPLEKALNRLVDIGLFTYWNYEPGEPAEDPTQIKFKKTKRKSSFDVWMDTRVYFDSEIEFDPNGRREKSKERCEKQKSDARIKRAKKETKAIKDKNKALLESIELEKELRHLKSH